MEVWDLKSRCWELNSSCGSPNSQSQGGPGWALGPFHPKPFPHSLFPLDSRSDHAEGGQHHPPAERLQLGFGCSQLGKAGLGMGRELWKTGIAPEVKIPAFPWELVFCSSRLSLGNKTFFTKSGNGISVSGSGEKWEGKLSEGFSLWDWIILEVLDPGASSSPKPTPLSQNQPIYPKTNPFIPKLIPSSQNQPLYPKTNPIFPKPISSSQK